MNTSTIPNKTIQPQQFAHREKYQKEIQECVVKGKVSRAFLNVITIGIYQHCLNNRLNEALSEQNISAAVEAIKSGANAAPSASKIEKLVLSGKAESLKFIINHTLSKNDGLKARSNIIKGINGGLQKSQDKKTALKSLKHYLKERKLHKLAGEDFWSCEKKFHLESCTIMNVFNNLLSSQTTAGSTNEDLVSITKSFALFNEEYTNAPAVERQSWVDSKISSSQYQLMHLILKSSTLTPQERADGIELFLSNTPSKKFREDQIIEIIMAENKIELLNLLLDKKIGLEAVLTGKGISSAVNNGNIDIVLKFLELGGSQTPKYETRISRMLINQIKNQEAPNFLAKAHHWNSTVIYNIFFVNYQLINRLIRDEIPLPTTLLEKCFEINELKPETLAHVMRYQVIQGNVEFLNRAHLWSDAQFTSIFLTQNLLNTLVQNDVSIPPQVLQRCLALNPGNDQNVGLLYSSLIRMANQGNTQPLKQLLLANPTTFSMIFTLAIRDNQMQIVNVLLEAYQKNPPTNEQDSALAVPYYTAVVTGNETAASLLAPLSNQNYRLSMSEIGFALGQSDIDGPYNSELLKEWLLPIISQKLNGHSCADKKISRLSNIQYNGFAPLVNTPKGLIQIMSAEKKVEIIKFEGMDLGNEMTAAMDELFK